MIHAISSASLHSLEASVQFGSVLRVAVQDELEITWAECMLNRADSYRSTLHNRAGSGLLILAIV
tara:strand:- start:253 stop:447 length:195 start_codon:yes stop_codon:yes gene_type:complete